MASHTNDAHEICGSPREQMRRVLARHLCAWITGHTDPVEHFLSDADLIMRDADDAGIGFHFLQATTGEATTCGAQDPDTKLFGEVVSCALPAGHEQEFHEYTRDGLSYSWPIDPNCAVNLEDVAGILGPDWTGGLDSVEWVRRQRDDD